MNTTKRGIYFISNNQMFELTLAFLNSLRLHNPDIPLCLIPYNNEYDTIKSLSKTYKFDIFNDHSILAICDEISKKFHGRIMGSYRKLAIWHGNYEEFIYIDIDTIILDSLNFAFKILGDFTFLTSNSNTSGSLKWTWKSTIFENKILSKEQINYATNTGFIASRKNAISIDCMLKKSKEAWEIREHMELSCQEQPFLNYLMVTSGESYSSLHALANKGVYKNIMIEAWAGIKGGKIVRNKIYFHYYGITPIFLVHWAGIWRPNKIDLLIHKILSFVRLRKKDNKPVINGRLPYKKLWEYYRNLNLES